MVIRGLYFKVFSAVSKLYLRKTTEKTASEALGIKSTEHLLNNSWIIFDRDLLLQSQI